jgi:hypothetical protein
MNKETLRMQMLAGVITESQYKEKLQENFFKNLIDKVRKKEEPIEPEKAKSELDGLTDEQALALYNEYNKQAGSIDPYDPHIGGYVQVYQTLANKLKTMYPNAIKESLNEHHVAGGIVGIGAINQIPSRAKEVYEDAFEHFLGKKYEIKEEMEDVNENMFSTGNEVNHPEGTGVIELVTDYASYADEIDADLGMDWESMTPKEELTWYKIMGDDGETYWFDEEELSEFN